MASARPLGVLKATAALAAVMALSVLCARPERGGRRAEVAGAVRLGALFAVHGAPVEARAGAACGQVREHYGIQRVEATLRALDAINADPALLRGLPLGAELRDSCWAPATALRQTIDLVRDAIADGPAPLSAAFTTVCVQNRTASDDAYSARPEYVRRAAPLVGVLGPGASSAAVQVQNLLQLFSIPQVSYSATSRELSDRARFSTFFRVVPSDMHQARLLVALLRTHNWTYVHAVHTDESYGQSGMAAFREAAARGGVCVAREEPLRAAPAPHEVDAALARLAKGPQVCVCWCEGRTARALLGGIARRAAAERPLQLVASDGWADRGDVVAGLEHAAHHALTLRIRSPYLAGFDAHYHALTPFNNQRNPWFTEFWEQKFNCSLSTQPPVGVYPCTGSESLATGYTQEPKLALVVRGVYAMAHALHDMRAAVCGAQFSDGLCATMLPFNVSLYRQHLARVRFRAPDGGLVAFDTNGDPPPELSEYDVMQLVRGGERGWRYARLGRWRRGTLVLRGGSDAVARRAARVHAACSAPCAAGQWARPGEDRTRCCWTCVTCPPLAVTRAAPFAGCKLCPPGYRPDESRTVCLPSPVEWGGSRWAHIAARVSGSAGLAAVVVCAATFWRHRHTPVVKSASRELCTLLLGAAAICHGVALAAASRPAHFSCAAVRLAAPALGGVYAAVLARTIRIARLVAAVERRPASRPRLLSSRAQVWTWIALSTPGVAIATWVAVVWPPTPLLLHPTRARSVLACGSETSDAQLTPLGPALALLAACAALAIRTRRLPHNLNETRFIGAATYATCVAWAAFALAYAATALEARSAALCACVSASASACVALSLGPRVWVCACRPQRNTRHNFLTTTSIRCHIGGYRPGEHNADPTRIEQRDIGSQTSSPTAGTVSGDERGWCATAGACARVTSSRAMSDICDDEESDDTLEIVIALLHHHHHAPPPCRL